MTKGSGKPAFGEDITKEFEDFHNAAQGTAPNRPVDMMMAGLGIIPKALGGASQFGDGIPSNVLSDAIGSIQTDAAKLPDMMRPLMDGLVNELRTNATSQIVNEVNAALNTDLIPDCKDFVEDNYPFGRDEQRPISLGDFQTFFGPNGTLDGFFVNHLKDKVDKTSGAHWVWRNGTAFGTEHSLASLRQFERADKIKKAFFSGGSSPGLLVPMTWTASGLKKSQKIVLSLDGGAEQRQFTAAQPSLKLNWPGDGTDYQLLSIDGKMVLDFKGPWAVLQLIKSGHPNASASRVILSYAFSTNPKDTETFDLTFDAAEIPFFLPELGDFKCPTAF